MAHLTIIHLLFCAIIVNLLIMILILVHCAYVDATCASFEKKINELTDQMIEIMKMRIAACSQSFNQIGRLIVSLIFI